MRKGKGFHLWPVRALLWLLAILLLLPMIQTFLYRFSSMTGMQEFGSASGRERVFRAV